MNCARERHQTKKKKHFIKYANKRKKKRRKNFKYFYEKDAEPEPVFMYKGKGTAEKIITDLF